MNAWQFAHQTTNSSATIQREVGVPEQGRRLSVGNVQGILSSVPAVIATIGPLGEAIELQVEGVGVDITSHALTVVGSQVPWSKAVRRVGLLVVAGGAVFGSAATSLIWVLVSR